MQSIQWMFYASIFMGYIFGYGLRFFQDRNKIPKPDWMFQFAASTTLSYLAYFLHLSVISFKIPLIDFKPFVHIQVWVAFISYFSVFIITQVDFILKRSWKDWINETAKKIAANSDKKTNHGS